jgi:hypothetical protein
MAEQQDPSYRDRDGHCNERRESRVGDHCGQPPSGGPGRESVTPSSSVDGSSRRLLAIRERLLVKARAQRAKRRRRQYLGHRVLRA